MKQFLKQIASDSLASLSLPPMPITLGVGWVICFFTAKRTLTLIQIMLTNSQVLNLLQRFKIIPWLCVIFIWNDLGE